MARPYVLASEIVSGSSMMICRGGAKQVHYSVSPAPATHPRPACVGP